MMRTPTCQSVFEAPTAVTAVCLLRVMRPPSYSRFMLPGSVFARRGGDGGLLSPVLLALPLALSASASASGAAAAAAAGREPRDPA
jgi:hypothetical protein